MYAKRVISILYVSLERSGDTSMRGFSRLTKKDLMKRIKNARVDSEIQAADLLAVVATILKKQLDEDIAREVKPLFFRGGTVTLETTSSLIAQEIRLQEAMLKDAINKELGKTMVKHFLWRVVSF